MAPDQAQGTAFVPASAPASLRSLVDLDAAVIVACPWNQRPCGGFLGLCDWRLRGLINAQIGAGRLQLDFGATGLIGAHRRLAGRRLVYWALGEPARFDAQRRREACREIATLVSNLNLGDYAIEVPLLPEAGSVPAEVVGSGFTREYLSCWEAVMKAEPSRAAWRLTWLVDEAVEVGARGQAA